MSKRAREEENQEVRHVKRREDEEPALTLGDIGHFAKELIVDKLEFASPVMILVNKSWNRFFREVEKISGETWDARMKRWYLGHLDPTELAYINFHERDKHINMNEALHKYTITHWLADKGAFSVVHSRPKSDPDRQKGLLSTTSFIDTTFEEFNADLVIAKMMKSPRWCHSKYFGKTAQEIKDEWEENRHKAATAGTANHLNLENYLNGKPCDMTTKEFALYKEYEKWVEEEDIIPFRTEQMAFDLPLLLCGSADALYIPRAPAKQFDEKGRRIVFLGDWKFSKEIKFENRWQKGICPLTENTQDCNFEHYCMQLRIYKIMFERNYGYVVKRAFLVILHENQDAPLRLEVPLIPRTEAQIIRYRRSIVCGAHKNK